MSRRKNRKRDRDMQESKDRTDPAIEGAQTEVSVDIQTDIKADPGLDVSTESPEGTPSSATAGEDAAATATETSAVTQGTDGSKAPRKDRKMPRWVRNTLRVIVAVFLCLAVFLCVSAAFSRHYQITFYQDVCRFLTGNVRIIFISDLHSRQYGEGNAELLADISSLSPDIIVLGGDMINWNDTDYEPMLDTCRKLAELAPVYAVLGNHECERVYNNGDQALVGRFEDAGVHMLRNESKIVKIGDNSIQLVGIDGTEAGFDKYGGKECMDQLDTRRNMYRVVLTHAPVLFREKLVPYSYDLGLAGHVHGGVVQIPRVGGLYSAEEGLLPEFSRGKYELSNGARLIIGAGLGDTGWFPRVNNRPELLVIDVNWC